MSVLRDYPPAKAMKQLKARFKYSGWRATWRLAASDETLHIA
jgi:hypothetical protein